MKVRKIVLLVFSFFPILVSAEQLPKGFVYLKNLVPSIPQDMHYAGYHNFSGRPIKGYQLNSRLPLVVY